MKTVRELEYAICDWWLALHGSVRWPLRVLLCITMAFLTEYVNEQTEGHAFLHNLTFGDITNLNWPILAINFTLYFTVSLMLTRIARDRNNFKELSIRDSLTGLYRDRNFMFDEIYRLRAEARRDLYGKTFLVYYFIDFNSFKAINDTYGHSIGDSVLRSGAVALTKILRPMDRLFRYGGDEYLLLALIYTDDVEILESKITNLSLKLEYAIKDLHVFNGVDRIPVSISVGCQISNPDNSVEEELKIVDRKMLEKKKRC
jgi:diguanylate cyclase (GGDEF)-like protein